MNLHVYLMKNVSELEARSSPLNRLLLGPSIFSTPILALARHQVAQVPTSQWGSGGGP